MDSESSRRRQEMEPYFNLSDPIGMIKKGVEGLIETKRQAYEDKLEFLARFEKAAAWKSDSWTYWDFEKAPEERAELRAENLSYKEICKRCDAWLKKNEASKPELIRVIEKSNKKTVLQEVRNLVEAGADPDEASLLKDTALEAARFHGYDDVFDYLIHNGATGEKDGFSNLHHAVRYGDLKDVEPLVDSFDILWRGFAKTSVLHEAVIAGKADVLNALLAKVSEEGRLEDEEVSHCCSLAISLGKTEMLLPFLECGVNVDVGLDATLEKYDTKLLKTLLAHGANVHEITDINLYHEDPLDVRDADGQPAIAEYVRALLEAGWTVDDLDEFEREQIRFVTEAYRIPKQDIHAPGFLDGASERSGTENPEERTSPYHLEMLRTGESSFAARRRMAKLPHAAWTADRFGQTTTRLPDGRWVQIGGEHEDFYDRDFAIFSDVVVHGPNVEPRVFLYPSDVFPPTDFHSASLVNRDIWIIGGLGYQGSRQTGVTPVHKLSLEDFSITKVETSGQQPGWISRHTAVVEGALIVLSGGKISDGAQHNDLPGTYEFDTQHHKWTRRS